MTRNRQATSILIISGYSLFHTINNLVVSVNGVQKDAMHNMYSIAFIVIVRKCYCGYSNLQNTRQSLLERALDTDCFF